MSPPTIKHNFNLAHACCLASLTLFGCIQQGSNPESSDLQHSTIEISGRHILQKGDGSFKNIEIPNQFLSDSNSAYVIDYLHKISESKSETFQKGKLNISTADFVKIRKNNKSEILVTDQMIYQFESDSWTSFVDDGLSKKVWEWITQGKIRTISSDLPQPVE